MASVPSRSEGDAARTVQVWCSLAAPLGGPGHRIDLAVFLILPSGLTVRLPPRRCQHRSGWGQAADGLPRIATRPSGVGTNVLPSGVEAPRKGFAVFRRGPDLPKLPLDFPRILRADRGFFSNPGGLTRPGAKSSISGPGTAAGSTSTSLAWRRRRGCSVTNLRHHTREHDWHTRAQGTIHQKADFGTTSVQRGGIAEMRKRVNTTNLDTRSLQLACADGVEGDAGRAVVDAGVPPCAGEFVTLQRQPERA